MINDSACRGDGVGGDERRSPRDTIAPDRLADEPDPRAQIGDLVVAKNVNREKLFEASRARCPTRVRDLART